MEALKNVQALVRSSSSDSTKHTCSPADIFSLTIYFLGELQMTHEEPMQCERLVKKSAQLATSSSRCASIQMSSLQVLWEKPTIYTHKRRIYSGAQSDVLVWFSLKVSHFLKLKGKLRSYRNGYWGRLRHSSSLTRYLALYDDLLLTSCNQHPSGWRETTSSRGFVYLWSGGLVLPFQRGTHGRSFS